MKIEQLEKKYSKSFDELKNEYELLGKEISSRSKRVQDLEEKITATQKRKSDVLREYSVEEKRVREYIDARAQLSSLGFPIDELPNVKTALFSMKNENFNPDAILQKLNAIADLETRKAALESELSVANGDLREKKALLIQLRQMQRSGLTIDQMERLRDVVSRISSRRGVNPDHAMTQFENDVLKNYDLSLGLESEILRLQETKGSIASELEERKKGYEAKEKSLSDRIKELEEKYQSQKEELKAYSELKALGIDGSRMLSWNELISSGKLDFGVVESELKRQGNLRTLEGETTKRIEELQNQQRQISTSVAELNQQKDILATSVNMIKEQTLKELENSRAAVLASVSKVTEEVKQASESTKNDLKATLSDLKNATTGFSGELTGVIQKAQEEAKKQSDLLETAERIGRYEAVLPLLKLSDNVPVTETEALLAMSNVTNTFVQWFRKQSATPARRETMELLRRTQASLNQAVETVGS